MVTKILDSISARLTQRTSKGLVNALSVAIGDGTILEGSKLPPIRIVASELGLSPSTVSTAWKTLAQAGVLRSDGRHGTVVKTRGGPGPTRYRRALERSIPFGLDLSTGVPDASLLPDLKPALNSLQQAWVSGSYLDDPIIPGLSDALRADWPYEVGQLAVVDGAMDALDQVATHLLHFGDTVIVENPSFPPMLDLLDALGVRTIGVDMDSEGIIPAQLEHALTMHPRAIFLQPRAQNPSGVSMSDERASQLATLVRATKVFVVEDDSAGAIASTPPISLGRFLPEQTVHIRSFSKSHGPDLRLAAMSGPASILDGIRERRLLGQGWTSRLLQAVLLDLLTRDESRTQVERARSAYAHRRQMVTTELGRRGIRTGDGDGLNLWLPVDDETGALVLLASRGIGTAAGSPFVTRDDGTAHLRITVGLVARDFAQVAGDLADAASIASSVGPR